LEIVPKVEPKVSRRNLDKKTFGARESDRFHLGIAFTNSEKP